MRRLTSRFVRSVRAPRIVSNRARRPRLIVQNLEDRTTPAQFLVTSADDTGPGTLRDAIDQANATVDDDEIVFDTAGLFATPQTITLASSLSVSGSGGALTITGPGTSNLTVSGGGAVGIMSSSAPTLNLTGFTMADGSSSGGGGALSFSGLAQLDHMVLQNNTAAGPGGGVYVGFGGFLSVKDCTISGNSGSIGAGIYFFFQGGLVVENSTISGNTSSTGSAGGYLGGGGILFWGAASQTPPAGFDPGAIVIRNSTITGNSTDGSGGGIQTVQFYDTLKVENSTISGNTSVGAGGGTFLGYSGYLSVQSSTISDNSSSWGGGIYFWFNGGLTVENSTISGNTTTSGGSFAGYYGGGGILFWGTPSQTPPAGFTPGTVVIQNSTIANNTTTDGGGGGILLRQFYDVLQVTNSTITGNTAGATGSSSGGYAYGGGGIQDLYGNGTIVVTDSIVSGNTNASGPDILSSGTVNADFSAIGDTTGFTLNGANNLIGENLLLGPLQNNGGPTLTIAPQAGSPAIDAGESISGVIFDQRGFGFVRSFNGAPDIGSVEVQPLGIPFGIAGGLTDITTPGGTSYTFTITYYDVTGPSNNAIDVSTVIGNDNGVVARMPDGSSVPATFVGIDNPTDGSPRTATYTFTPPGGSWDVTEDGTVAIEVVADQIKDVEGNPVPAGSVGAFQVLLPRTLVVTTPDDSGPGSLRDAIDQANDLASDDSITFDPTVFGAPQTILLQSALAQISADGGNLDIIGPGAANLTVNGGGTVRVIDSLAPTLNLSGFTITGGLADGSAGIPNGEFGGGIRAGGTVTLDHMVVQGNNATGSGYFDIGAGGGIGMTAGSTLIVTNSTIANNTAEAKGGGIFFRNGGTLVLQNSTVSGNTASPSGSLSGLYGGGGIFFLDFPPGSVAGSIEITNSTIANNSTTGSGGGIATMGLYGLLLIQESTISGNTADASGVGPSFLPYYYGGGGINTLGKLTGLVIANSIVSGNTNPDGPDIRHAGGYFPYAYAYYSAIGDATGTTITGPNNLIGQDLHLTALGDHGGPTQTFGFQPDSPLVDAGSAGLLPAGLDTDQRGLSREFGAGLDIGSIELQPPPVTINQAAGQADPATGDTIAFTVEFGEPVTGFDGSDVDLSGSSVGGTLVAEVVPISASTYTVLVTGMSGQGTVVATIPAGAATDDFGFDNLASTSTDNTVLFDQVPPTVTINQGATQADPTGVGPITFDVVFSEPVVGFDPSDIHFTGSTVGGTLTPSILQTSPTTYTVSVSGMTGQGTVVASIPADAVTDVAGNLSGASTSTDNSVLFDSIAPTVTINQAAGQDDPTSNTTITFNAVFSEPVTGFDGSDIVFTGSTAGGTLTALVTQTGPTTYTVAVTGMTTRGTVVASIPAGAATDLAGNLSEASTSTDNSVEFLHAGVIGLTTTTFDTTEGSVVHLTLSRTGGNEGVVSVDLAALVGTAHASDFTLPATTTVTWGDGDAADKTFDVTIVDDSLNEGRENFTINLSNAIGGATLGATAAAISIAPSDGKVILGAPPKGQKPSFVFTDSDGDLTTVALGGKVAGSTATVYMTDPDGDGHGPIEWIDLAGTDSAKSTLTITVKKPKGGFGDVRTTLGEVTGTGLKILNAKTTDLVGTGIHPTGWLGTLMIGNVSGGADITLTGTPPATLKKPAVRITAGQVGDGTDVTVGGVPLAGLTAINFGDGTITAPSVGSITMKGKAKTRTAAAIPGNFNADVAISGVGLDPVKGVALKSLKVAGAVTGSTITVEKGNVGLVLVGSFVDSLMTAGYAGLPDGSGTFHDPSTIGPFIVKAKTNGFVRSDVLASTIKPVTLASIDPVGPGVSPSHPDGKFGFIADKVMTGLTITNKAQKFKFNPKVAGAQGLTGSDFRVLDKNGPLIRRTAAGLTSALTESQSEPMTVEPMAAESAPVVVAPASPSLATYSAPEAFNFADIIARIQARAANTRPAPIANVVGYQAYHSQLNGEPGVGSKIGMRFGGPKKDPGSIAGP